MVLGVGGAAFYNNALVQLDKRALTSDTMRQSLDVFRRLKSYVDDKASGRDWNVATDMVIKGRAGFQFMGDWAKGEFLAAGQQPGVDFSCTPAPGTANAYTFNVDSFAMFQLKAWEAQKAQGYLAYLLMGQDFQEKFNLRKGSIPARLHMDMDKFDACAKASSKDFVAASKAGTLVPSVAHGMAVSTAAQDALRAVISEFWSNGKTSVDDAMAKLVLAASSKPGRKPL